MNKLNSLTTMETRALMMKYFNKVVTLKDTERRLNLHCSEMEVSIYKNMNLCKILNLMVKFDIKMALKTTSRKCLEKDSFIYIHGFVFSVFY